MTQEFLQASNYAFFGNSQLASYREPLLPPRFRMFRTGVPGEIGWEILHEDFRGGEAEFGNFAYTWNKSRPGSGLDARFPRSLLLNQLQSATTLSAGSVGPLSSAYFAGTLAMARGGTANVCLLKETSTTDPTPLLITYTSDGIITGLWPVVLNNTNYLAIGETSDPVRLVSNLTTAGPATPGEMHTDTEPTWGIIMSPINATAGTQTLLIYMGTGNTASIRTLNSTDAIGTQPTSKWANIGGGGWAIGAMKLKDFPIRAFWVIPEVGQSSSVLADGTIATVRSARPQVMHTNLEGTDMLPLPDCPLAFIGIAFKWRQGIFMSDFNQSFYYDGETYELINWEGQGFRTNNLANAGDAQLLGGWPDGDNLYLLGYSDNQRRSRIIYYDSVLRTFSSVSESTEDYTSGLAIGAMPISPATRYLHWLAADVDTNQIWRRQYAPPMGANPFFLQTAGALTGEAFFDASANWWSPVWDPPPPLTGYPFVVDAIGTGADVDAGGTTTVAATILYQIGDGSLDATGNVQAWPNALLAVTGLPTGVWQWAFNPNPSLQHRLQIQITSSRNTGDTQKTPNPLPFITRGRSKVPIEVFQALANDIRGR